MKKAKIFLLFIFFLFLMPGITLAENLCPQNACEGISDLNLKVSCLQNATNNCSKQSADLTSQINYMDTQVKLTTNKIYQTQNQILQLDDQIASLSGQIDKLQNSLGDLSKILLERIVQTYKRGNSSPFSLLLSANGFSDLLSRLKYIRVAQAHDKKLMFTMQETKDNYTDQKKAREDKKKQLDGLKITLAQQKIDLGNQQQAKKNLLEITNNDQQQYLNLLAKAKAQLAAFNSFVVSEGGASLLSGQTKCNDWGCYYNQRDSLWGALSLNNTSYTLANSGCLVTSMAMVATHYGHKNVNPISIESNSSNFAVYYPAYLNYTISVDGATFSRQGISYSQIDGELSAGRPIVVGIGSGPSHFVVLVSGSNGDYKMNDPYQENGQEISFTSKYSIGSITEIDKVSVN